ADATRQHGAGMDADAVPERRLACGRALFVQASETRPHGEGGGEGAVGVVRRAEGSPEHRLDLVANVLEDETPLGPAGRLHLREVLGEVVHDLARPRALDPRGEVAEVREKDRHLLEPPLEAGAPGEDLVADLARHVAAEGLADALALLQSLQHAVEAL